MAPPHNASEGMNVAQGHALRTKKDLHRMVLPDKAKCFASNSATQGLAEQGEIFVV